MKKRLLKATMVMALSLLLSINTVSFASAGTINNDDIYEKYVNIDLQNTVLTVNDNTVEVEVKKNLSRTAVLDKGLLDKGLLEDILSDNNGAEEEIINAINNGKEIVGISVTEHQVEEINNIETGEITSALLTNREVDELSNVKSRASINGGEVTKRGKLTLTSLLVSDPNMAGIPRTYALSTTANWDVSGYNSDGAVSPAVGEDFIGLTWPSSYEYNGTSGASGWNNKNVAINFYRTSVVGNAGVVWSFEDKFATDYAFIAAERMSAYAQIEYNPSATEGYKTFTASYIHTYDKKKGGISIGASSSGVSGGLSLSNVDKQWTAISPLTVKIR